MREGRRAWRPQYQENPPPGAPSRRPAEPVTAPLESPGSFTLPFEHEARGGALPGLGDTKNVGSAHLHHHPQAQSSAKMSLSNKAPYTTHNAHTLDNI